MLTDEQKQEIRRLRAEGMTYERIGSITGHAMWTVRDIAWDVQKPNSSKDTYMESTETRKLIRRIKRKARYIQALRQSGTLKPCEHCRWRKNKDPVPVCVVCYRERFAAPGQRMKGKRGDRIADPL